MINPTIPLFVWPLISLALFARLGVVHGLIVSVLAGYLLLPDSFELDLPLLPAYEKRTAITAGLVLSYVVLREEFHKVASESQSADKTVGLFFNLCMIILLLIPALVYVTNRSPLYYGPTVLSGHSPKDVISGVWITLVALMPYIFARRLLCTQDSHRILLRSIVIAGLLYSLLAVFEVRMSPQLNNWIYGYFPHAWLQHIRGGGFRPVIFLKHGLWLGFFLFSVIILAIALAREEKGSMKLTYLLAALWMSAVLVISRNLGATLLAVLFLPVILVFGRSLQIWAAVAVAALFLSYPLVLQTKILPIDQFLATVEQASPERAQSLETRLTNDERFLERAQEKPLFGWGRYGRWRIYDETGEDVSIADGLWIILLGTTGWVGFLGFFGLFVFPIVVLLRARKRKDLSFYTTSMAVVTAANFIYLIPNSALNPIGYIMAGAMAGFAQFDLKRARSETEAEADDDPGRRVRYTRFERKDQGAAAPRGRAQAYRRSSFSGQNPES